MLKGDSAPRPKAVLKAQMANQVCQHVLDYVAYSGVEARAGESSAAGPARCAAACGRKLNEGLTEFEPSVLAYLYQKPVRYARRQGPCEATECCRAGTGEAPASTGLFKMSLEKHVAWLLGRPQTNGGARHVVSPVVSREASKHLCTCLSLVDAHLVDYFPN